MTSQELVTRFASSVAKYYELRDLGIVSEKDFNTFMESRSELERRGAPEQLDLAVLLADPRPAVRLEAASALRSLMPEEAMKHLQELSQLAGLTGFIADNIIDGILGKNRLEGPPPLTP